MTDQQPHTPTREQFKALLARIPAKYGEVIAHTAVLDDFERMIDQTIAAAEQRGAERALRHAQHIVAGFEHTIDEARNRDDMINTGYLIQKIDTEIQDLLEGDDD